MFFTTISSKLNLIENANNGNSYTFGVFVSGQNDICIIKHNNKHDVKRYYQRKPINRETLLQKTMTQPHIHPYIFWILNIFNLRKMISVNQ